MAQGGEATSLRWRDQTILTTQVTASHSDVGSPLMNCRPSMKRGAVPRHVAPISPARVLALRGEPGLCVEEPPHQVECIQ